MTDLFSFIPARTSDPQTSIDAGILSRHFAADHRAKILAFLTTATEPSHYVAISEGTGLDRHAVGRRLIELQRDGRISCAGIGRLPNGNRARVWVAR